MLFIIVADCLNWFLQNNTSLMPQPARLNPHTIQYADDTLIICEAHPTTIKIVGHVLEVYMELTGLKINKENTLFVPIAIPANLVSVVWAILSSPVAQLPIRYLGLPLTVKKPTKLDFQPMLAVVQAKIQGWTLGFLSYGGRITLVKAMLSGMPLHYLQAF